MELGWLEDFLALVESGQFSTAAESRNITQPAFSRRIKSLENWIGTPLFFRDTHSVELTGAGENFRPMAEDIVQRIHFAREQTRLVAGQAATTIRIVSTHSLSVQFLPPFLDRLEASTHAGNQISLTTNNTMACEMVLRHGGTHFLLCHRHNAAATLLQSEYYDSQVVGQDLLMPVSIPCDGGKAARYTLPGTADDPLPCLSYSTSSGLGRILAAIQDMGMPPHWCKTVFASHVAMVLVSMTRSGRGMAWLPQSLVAADLASGGLVPAGDDSFNVPIEICLIRPRIGLPPAAENFWAEVKRLTGTAV